MFNAALRMFEMQKNNYLDGYCIGYYIDVGRRELN